MALLNRSHAVCGRSLFGEHLDSAAHSRHELTGPTLRKMTKAAGLADSIVAPPYAATLGAIVLYPTTVTIRWRLHRLGLTHKTHTPLPARRGVGFVGSPTTQPWTGGWSRLSRSRPRQPGGRRRPRLAPFDQHETRNMSGSKAQPITIRTSLPSFTNASMRYWIGAKEPGY